MIVVENINSNVYVFGRDKEETYIKKVKFEPYFYVEDSNGEFESIDGKKLKKIVVDNPKEVKDARELYTNHYEADVRFCNRFIIDKVDKIEREDIRICYLDIEVQRTKNGYESAEVANNPILAIGCYDNFSKQFKLMCVGKTHKNEVDMINEFVDYIKITNPDMMIGWNSSRFDFPFILNRMRKLGINPDLLGREEGRCYSFKTNIDYKTKIFGRVLFDLMEGYKKMNPGGRESWALDYISKYERLGGKEEYRGELDDLYKDDIDKFISYNKRDVELLVLLNEKLNIVEFFDEVRRTCFCQFEDVFMSSKIADCLCLKKCNGKVILPSVRDNKTVTIKGGFVHESEPKLHNNIAVFDMKSLYPSIIISANMSYETYLEKEKEGCVNIDNKHFFDKSKEGLIPSIVKPMLELRKQVRSEMRGLDRNSREYKSLYIKQYALKVIANSFYGILLLKVFRLFKWQVADAITYTARKTIKEVHKWFEDKGFRIVAGDTDSAFVEMGDKSIEEMKEINNEINLYFKTYFKQFGIEEEDNIFKLEFEKVYKTVFFKMKASGGGVKKRYCGRIIWEEGKDVDKFGITGFETVRSDNPQIGRDFLKQVLSMICYEKDKSDIDVYIQEFKNKIMGEFTAEDIAIPISITKPLQQYANQIHARASRLANDKHDADIKVGDKVKYLYVKGKNRNENVICFKSHKWCWDGYQIDYPMMIRRLVDLKVGPIYHSLGWKYKGIEINRKRNKKEIKFEDTLKQLGLW